MYVRSMMYPHYTIIDCYKFWYIVLILAFAKAFSHSCAFQLIEWLFCQQTVLSDYNLSLSAGNSRLPNFILRVLLIKFLLFLSIFFFSHFLPRKLYDQPLNSLTFAILSFMTFIYIHFRKSTLTHFLYQLQNPMDWLFFFLIEGNGCFS